MQEGAFEEMETLCPYGGFAVKAVEKRLGEGKLTPMEQSFLFEARTGEIVGFDLPVLRLVRLKDVHTVEVVYSIQGELRNASFRVVCTFLDGIERDELPLREDSYRTSLFRAITGGVVARFLVDHSNAKMEGLTQMTDDAFQARIKDLERNISLFPDKKQYEEDLWFDEELRKRSLEAADSEPQIWNDPYRDRLYYTGTNPSMTVDNAFEKIDLLQDDWVNGRLSPSQRARSVAIDYSVDLKQNQLGYSGSHGKPSIIWKERAERVMEFEKSIGVNILGFL
jgi:hypothetical protein